jgi:hypothetical protein
MAEEPCRGHARVEHPAHCSIPQISSDHGQNGFGNPCILRFGVMVNRFRFEPTVFPASFKVRCPLEGFGMEDFGKPGFLGKAIIVCW